MASTSSTIPPKTALLLSMYPHHSIPPEDYADPEMPWEAEGFVPLTRTGKQKSPNVIRGELQRYMDHAKQHEGITQTFVIEEQLQVSSNSFYRFMNPKSYKDPWSACENGTYWAAAAFLERRKFEQALEKKLNPNKKKRPLGDVSNHASASANANTNKKSKSQVKAEMSAYMQKVADYDKFEFDGRVYDSCPELVKKIKAFLQRDGVVKGT